MIKRSKGRKNKLKGRGPQFVHVWPIEKRSKACRTLNDKNRM